MLLDTHIVLWWLMGDRQRIGPAIVDAIERDPGAVIVSAVVLWESAIKRNLGKLEPPLPDLLARLVDAGTKILPITGHHGDRAGGLPLHHRDPFDRLLIAQAQIERLPIATADSAFQSYEIDLVVVDGAP